MAPPETPSDAPRTTARSTRSPEQILSGQQSIHRSGTEAFEIESDKLEAQSLEDPGELRGHGGIERLLQFVAGDLNADDFPVMPHPELPEA